MTYAPADLLAVRLYLLTSTGLSGDAVGIVGDPEHLATGGAHLGNDDLARIGKLTSDYTKRESPRDRPGSNAASALDVGWFDRGGRDLRDFSLWLVRRCVAGDPRCADIREVIYSPDGRTVRRYDRLGIRSTGDSSHLWHTHITWFRDSEGRRARLDNFLGLLKEYFEGSAVSVWSEISPSRQGPTSTGNALVATYDSVQLDIRPALTRLEVAAAAETARDAGMRAAVEALAAAITAGGGSVDTAAVLAGVVDAVDRAVAPLQDTIADLRAQLADRDARLAAALAPPAGG